MDLTVFPNPDCPSVWAWAWPTGKDRQRMAVSERALSMEMLLSESRKLCLTHGSHKSLVGSSDPSVLQILTGEDGMGVPGLFHGKW